MKVKELIAALKKFDGDLEVYAYTDHGQSPEKVNSPEEILVGNTSSHLWDDWTFQGQGYDDEGEYNIKAVLL